MKHTHSDVHNARVYYYVMSVLCLVLGIAMIVNGGVLFTIWGILNIIISVIDFMTARKSYRNEQSKY